MKAESKAKILQAIDQAMEHCQKVAGAADEVAERDRLLQLHRSLADHRIQVAAAQEDFPSDTGFVLEFLTDSAPKLSDADSIALFSDRLSQLIRSERK